MAGPDGEVDVADVPSEAADSLELVRRKLPPDILDLYDVYSYRGAAVVLAESHPAEFADLMDALRAFKITTTMIRTAGGNESDIPKLVSQHLRPRGWHETTVQGDLHVKQSWREAVGTTKDGKPKFAARSRTMVRTRYLDGHKVDYVKGRVAFDLEWNSKDQTFDRDLYAFSAFAQTGVVDVGVLLTRSAQLNPVFRELGPSLDKDGREERKKSGEVRMTHEKYGASTTWMGKLLYRLNAGRNGACPVLAFGITPRSIEDFKVDD